MENSNFIGFILFILMYVGCTTDNSKLYDYYPSGEIKSECFGNANDGYQCISFYTNGKILAEYFSKNRILHGECREFDSLGQLMSVSLFENDMRNGNAILLNPEKKLIQNCTFLNDTLNGFYEIYEDSILVESGNFEKGDKEGWINFYNKNGNVTKQIIDIPSIKGRLVNGEKVYTDSGEMDLQKSYFLNVDSQDSIVLFTYQPYFEDNIDQNIIVLGNYSDLNCESFEPKDTIIVTSNPYFLKGSLLKYNGGVFVERLKLKNKRYYATHEFFFRFLAPPASSRCVVKF